MYSQLHTLYTAHPVVSQVSEGHSLFGSQLGPNDLYKLCKKLEFFFNRQAAPPVKLPQCQIRIW